MNNMETIFRKLTVEEIGILEKQGCLAENWDTINISPGLDL